MDNTWTIIQREIRNSVRLALDLGQEKNAQILMNELASDITDETKDYYEDYK